MAILLRSAGVWLAVFLACASVGAEPAESLTPPIAESSTDVPYPDGARGDAAVVLELVVQADGSVASATVSEGEEPFAEAARAAALGWRFSPARRDGVAVAARIRARVAFRSEAAEPIAVAPPTPPSDPASRALRRSTTAEADVSEPPLEVVVQGERREIGQTTLARNDIRAIPGAFGDAFRSIEALPGVTPLLSGVPYFYVRGAPPNNAGYFVDGVRVPLLFHLGLAQSVIHPGLVENVDFFPSAAPARYGGVAGGIVAGRTREPAEALRGEANLRLVDAGALVETPFAEGRGSALVAGRYGYPGFVIGAVTDDMRIGYWDYQARLGWKVGHRDALGVFAFGSHDYLATRSDSDDPEARKELTERFVSDFHRVDLRYDRALPAGRLRLAVTGGLDSHGSAPTYVTSRSLGGRVEVDQQWTTAVRVRGGVDVRAEDYDLRVTRQGPREPAVPQSANPPPKNLTAGAHADVVFRVTPRIEVVPGLRFDVFASSRRREAPASGRARTVLPAIDPRLSARVQLASGLAWLSTVGLSHQYPSLRVGDIPAPLLTVPGFPFEHQQLQTALQASQGVELVLPGDLTFTATAFHSEFWGLTDLSAVCFQFFPPEEGPPMPGDPAPPYVCPNNRPTRGRTQGVELMLRRAFSNRLSGWLSYTLSRATRDARFLRADGTEALASVPSEFDRTHVLNAVLALKIGRGWQVGSRFLFYTGTPYSRLEGSLPVPPYNAYRLADFHRLDFRMEKRWRIGSSGALALVFEGQNVTLQKETSNLGLECEGEGTPQGGTNRCRQSTIGPLTIPSVGLEAFF